MGHSCHLQVADVSYAFEKRMRVLIRALIPAVNRPLSFSLG